MTTLKQDLAATVLELAELYPEWRFGQLVENVAGWTGNEEPANAWDVSDADLLRAAREHLSRKHASAGTSRSA